MTDECRTCTPRFDFVSLGESILRLTVPTRLQLEDTRSLDLAFANVENNVRVALARLDWRAGWVSRLPDHAMSHAIPPALRQRRRSLGCEKCTRSARTGANLLFRMRLPAAICASHLRPR